MTFEDSMPSKRMVPEQEVFEVEERLERLAAAKDAEIANAWRTANGIQKERDALSAEIAALTEQRDRIRRDYEDTRDCLINERQISIGLLGGGLVAKFSEVTEQRDELRRQNAEKADLLDRCIALFRRNGDYPTLTQEIVTALTNAPQAAPLSTGEPVDG